MIVRNCLGLAGRQALGHAHGVLQNNAGRDAGQAKTAILAVHIAMVHVLTVRSLTAGACIRPMISMVTDNRASTLYRPLQLIFVDLKQSLDR
jgi:hypothetical protein